MWGEKHENIFAAALGGSLTKLGVNGGLVASAGFFSFPTQAGPSQGNRPQADNSQCLPSGQSTSYAQ